MSTLITLSNWKWISRFLIVLCLVGCDDHSQSGISHEQGGSDASDDHSLAGHLTIEDQELDPDQTRDQGIDSGLQDAETGSSCEAGTFQGCASPLHTYVCSDNGVDFIVEPCPLSTRCVDGLRRVISCLGDADCLDDTFCFEGECVAYPHASRGDSNDRCALLNNSPAFNPEVQCRWTGGQVSGQPLVIDLDADDVPEILVVSGGNVVAISGETCEEVGRSIGQFFSGESSLAAGDIDADGEVEIIAMGGFGSITALNRDLTPQWTAVTRVFGIASAPAIADLDGDGAPEVIAGGTALNGEDGTVHALSPMEPVSHGFGPIPAIADVDGDGAQEILYGNRMYSADMIDLSSSELRALTPGHVAVADFDPVTPEPEVAVVTGVSRVRVQRLSGEVIFGPYAVPDSVWAGGAPNVADFDGDGFPEIGTAGSHNYAVFDLECVGNPLPEGCEAEGIRWTKSSRDSSSGSTGSTTFDFDGDGRVEVVYNDECFLRVYDGSTGEVLLALPNTTGTLIEAPIVADADGDGRSEIIVSSDQGFPCDEPDPHTGTAPRQTQGVTVIRDGSERWVRSRRIWNQNAYSITNVAEDGSIPAIPEPNWLRFNSFRENLQPDGKSHEAPDLTIRGDEVTRTSCGEVTLKATISNRGAQLISSGIRYTFSLEDHTPLTQPPLCDGETVSRLAVGESIEVRCVWREAPSENTVVWVYIDLPTDPNLPAGARAECVEANNRSSVFLSTCSTE